MNFVRLLYLTALGLSLTLWGCAGSKQSRASSGSQAGAQQRGPMGNSGDASGMGQQDANQMNQGFGQQPPAGSFNNAPNQGGSNSLGDLLGQAGDLLKNLGSGEDDQDTDTSTGTSTSTVPSVKLTDFTDLMKRSQLFFTINPNGFVAGDSPHGKVMVYYTKNIEDLVGTKNFKVPEGTIAIKIFDNDDTKEGPEGLAIMQKKQAGYDADGNDWYYRLVNNWSATVDGKEGIVDGCKSCHGAQGGKDFDYLKGLQKAAGL